MFLAAALALPAPAQTTLPGTAPLTAQGDLAAAMVEGIHTYLDRETAAAPAKRAGLSPNRDHLRKIIGAVDPRVSPVSLALDATTDTPAQVASGPGYKVFAVRWPVFDDVWAEGLLLDPVQPPVARIVALPDADQSPEMLAGLAPGVDPASQFARRLAENGCQVLVPVLIDRSDTWSGIPGIRMTNQPHREFLYRMAFEAGRHIIGYEVEKVLAAVDWFEAAHPRARIGVAGYGEGGLLALYAAALDPRIDATLVSGYFQPRENLWQEPIYRDVWGLVREFGDAEIAALVAPRALVVEAARSPEVAGPPPATKDRRGACPNGRLTTPPLEAVRSEVARARPFFARLHAADHLQLVESAAGSDAALRAFLRALGSAKPLQPPGAPLTDSRGPYDPAPRLHHQFDELIAHTQSLVRAAPARRAEFWAKADPSSPQRWIETTKIYRDTIWNEMIGRLPPPSEGAHPRTRLIYETPKFRGYEVMLDVWPDVFAYGILLVPKDIRPGERRPVVVCQHGLEGRPQDVADPASDSHYYHRFAARLADEGFVTYAPQNPYIGRDRFRLLQRKAHPLKLSLFSFILGQHQQTLEWLASLPFVDPARIGFYGLSYGGKTAVRVPPLLDRYALSICSADYNEWVWKNTSVESHYSYMITEEYDMIEFNLANLASYAELAELMAPRPFMVERGHDDGVAPDEWVAYEYAKVRRFYDVLGLAGRTRIEFFSGPHTIHGVGTFEFLRRHLNWPR
ncbi:MAG TPA: dienelactone hydrolase family protein [Bryobacterales bacterium]|nr:dienelactone hydrolase family protein [Bryobacterales bacterium]